MTALVSNALKYMVSKGGFASAIISNLCVTNVSVEQGKVTCEMLIEKVHLNSYDSLHGGVICSLIDIGGSIAICLKGKSEYSGVSTDLSVSFQSSGKPGEWIKMESICHKVGRNLAFTNTTIFSQTGTIIATGSHTKYLGGKQNAKL